MNAVLPDDLSHYERPAVSGGTLDVSDSLSDENSAPSGWDGHAGLEMEPGTDMLWIGPEPLL